MLSDVLGRLRHPFAGLLRWLGRDMDIVATLSACSRGRKHNPRGDRHCDHHCTDHGLGGQNHSSERIEGAFKVTRSRVAASSTTLRICTNGRELEFGDGGYSGPEEYRPRP
jgi:hypothetical protein